jgi:glycosyltransferase involved in cell wall biosynthesis
MHIAFLTPEYPHPAVMHSAGIGTSIKNIAEGLCGQGIKVTLFIYSQKEDSVIEADGIQLHLMKHRAYKFGGFYRYRKHVNAYINTVIKENNISLIEAADWTGITAFMKCKVPIVIRLHGSDTYFCHLEGRTQKKKNFFFEKKALKNATAIASVSAYTARVTKELFGIKKAITVIPNLIDTNRFIPNEVPIQEGMILNFGSVIRKKGVLALAAAFNSVVLSNSDAHLLFLGKDVRDAKTGVSTKQLIEELLSEEAKSKVSFVDAVPYDQVQKYIAQAAVICLPSLAEAFPMTWLEAMAMEKGLVTSNIGWAKELMVDGETGYMVDPTHIESLSTALSNQLKDVQNREKMARQAREHLLAHFSKEQILQKNVAFYTKVINRGGI